MTKKRPQEGAPNASEKEPLAKGFERIKLEVELIWLRVRDTTRSDKLERAIHAANRDDLIVKMEDARRKLDVSLEKIYANNTRSERIQVKKEAEEAAGQKEEEHVPFAQEGAELGVDYDELYEVSMQLETVREHLDAADAAFKKLMEADTAAKSLVRDVERLEAILKLNTHEAAQEYVVRALEEVASLKEAIETGRTCLSGTASLPVGGRSQKIRECTSSFDEALSAFTTNIQTLVQEIADAHPFPKTGVEDAPQEDDTTVDGESVAPKSRITSAAVDAFQKDATLIDGERAALKNLVATLEDDLISWGESSANHGPQDVLGNMKSAANLLADADLELRIAEGAIKEIQPAYDPVRKHREELIQIRKKKNAIRKRLHRKVIDLGGPSPEAQV